jgi:hypothetical protein
LREKIFYLAKGEKAIGKLFRYAIDVEFKVEAGVKIDP